MLVCVYVCVCGYIYIHECHTCHIFYSLLIVYQTHYIMTHRFLFNDLLIIQCYTMLIIHIYIHIHIYTHKHIHTYKYTHTNTHIHTYTYIHTPIYMLQINQHICEIILYKCYICIYIYNIIIYL